MRSPSTALGLLPWLLAFLIPFFLAGCGGEEGPRWTRLAVGAAPVFARGDTPATRGAEIVEQDGGTWLRIEIPRQRFRPRSKDGRWISLPGLIAIGRPAGDLARYRLRAPGREFAYVPEVDQLTAPGSFAMRRGRLYLLLKEGDEPPPSMHLDAFAARRAVREDGTWRIVGDRFTGDGFALWSGERMDLDVDVAPQSTLRFATVIEPAFADPTEEERTVFRVRFDGTLVFEADYVPKRSYAWHEVPLKGREPKRITFQVDGALAYAAFVAPVVGPADVGAWSAQEAGRGRPDIVVFLADTFRADNLAVYGGTEDLTPATDAFAEECKRFRRAWSVSTHTLPTHASLFTGLFPPQTRVMDESSFLSEDAHTLAEILSAAGYRTGSITGGAQVSTARGLEQGFEFFDGYLLGVDAAVARARDFLEADDGRPTFLFVQTYETHTPYEISPETIASHGDRLDLGGDSEALLAVLQGVESDPLTPDLERLGAQDALRALHQLYLGKVVDLDRGFREFLRTLDDLGLSESAYVVFTSDHGEAFCEHDQLLHGGVVHEEQLRVPILVRGPGVSPGDVDYAASHIDFAPTVLAMASITAPESWVGRSWLTLDVERPIFAFQAGYAWHKDANTISTMAIVDGSRKVILPEDIEALEAGRILKAYDLMNDPAETDELLSAGATWPMDLAEKHTEVGVHFLTPVLEAGEGSLSPEARELMQKLGYAGRD